MNPNKKIPNDLMVPPGAVTDTSIAILWESHEEKNGLLGYKILLDNQPFAMTDRTDYTLENLTPGKTYEVSIEALFEDGCTRRIDRSVNVKTKEATTIVNIVDYGAVGDGITLNTLAIQTAIDHCPEHGTVIIPKGTFVTGAIFLKSKMTLFLEAGSILLGSGHLKDYPMMQYRFEGLETQCYASLINTRTIVDPLNPSKLLRHDHISIIGPGTIDANGSVLRKQQLFEKKGKPGRALCIRDTDDVYLKDITVRQSPAWCIHLIYCNNVSVNHIKVHTKYDQFGRKYEGIANGDGLNPDSCSNVYIFNSMIESQDDCIAIKSGRDHEGRTVGIPSEHIRILNCHFHSGFGVAIGSEMSGSVRDVIVFDCTFNNTYSIGSVKAPRGRGAIVEDIRYSNCTLKNYDLSHEDCKWFRGGIYVDQFYSHDLFDLDQPEPIGSHTSKIRNITFENILVDTLTGNAIYMAGLPESKLENIILKNVYAVGKFGLKAFNIEGLRMENVTVLSKEDEPLILQNVYMKD